MGWREKKAQSWESNEKRAEYLSLKKSK